MNLVLISVIQMLSASTQLVITTVHVMLDTEEMVLIVLVSQSLSFFMYACVSDVS